MKDCTSIQSEKSTKIMDKNNDDIKYYLLNYSPLIFINGHMFKGNYQNTLNIVKAFCNSFEEMPTDCNKLDIFDEFKNYSSYGIFKFIFLNILIALFVAVIVVALFYILYRKKMSTQFKQNFDSRINEALSKYYQKEESNYGGIKDSNN